MTTPGVGVYTPQGGTELSAQVSWVLTWPEYEEQVFEFKKFKDRQ